MLITGRNEVVAKDIFLHLSVILFTGGVCLSACLDTPSRADTPPGSRHPPPPLPRADTFPGSRHPLPEQTPPSRHPPPPEADSSIRSTSGRYASYWNAFLFENIS